MNNLQPVEFGDLYRDEDNANYDTEQVTQWMDIETEYLFDDLDDYWWWREFAHQDEGEEETDF
jgi:hypothetical protein